LYTASFALCLLYCTVLLASHPSTQFLILHSLPFFSSFALNQLTYLCIRTRLIFKDEYNNEEIDYGQGNVVPVIFHPNPAENAYLRSLSVGMFSGGTDRVGQGHHVTAEGDNEGLQQPRGEERDQRKMAPPSGQSPQLLQQHQQQQQQWQQEDMLTRSALNANSSSALALSNNFGPGLGLSADFGANPLQDAAFIDNMISASQRGQLPMQHGFPPNLAAMQQQPPLGSQGIIPEQPPYMSHNEAEIQHLQMQMELQQLQQQHQLHQLQQLMQQVEEKSPMNFAAMPTAMDLSGAMRQSPQQLQDRAAAAMIPPSSLRSAMGGDGERTNDARNPRQPGPGGGF